MNCITLIFKNPFNESGLFQTILLGMDYFFTALFTVEMFLKIISYGFIADKNTYLRNGWNIIDFLIVLGGWITILIGGGGVVANIETLRPLRLVTHMKGLRQMLQHLIDSLQLFLNATALLMFVLMMWALVGLQFFKGKLRQRCFYAD
eukprot:782218_1